MVRTERGARCAWFCARSFPGTDAGERRLTEDGRLCQWAWLGRTLGPGPTLASAGVEVEGLVRAMRAHGYQDAVVVGSALMHYSFNKAGDLLGLGVASVVRVPTDASSRMRYAAAAVATVQRGHGPLTPPGGLRLA